MLNSGISKWEKADFTDNNLVELNLQYSYLYLNEKAKLAFLQIRIIGEVRYNIDGIISLPIQAVAQTWCVVGQADGGDYTGRMYISGNIVSIQATTGPLNGCFATAVFPYI